jgi:protein-tyrosine phosphatase
MRAAPGGERSRVTSAPDRLRICFVCLGNICRSPTAAAVFERDVRAAGLSERFVVESAGTGGWHVGEPAHPQTRATAADRGVAIVHRARLFRADDFARLDWILAMDADNQRDLLALAPDGAERAKVHLFRSFEAGAPHRAEVPDPYGRGGFDGVFEICERASAGLLAHLRRLHAL